MTATSPHEAAGPSQAETGSRIEAAMTRGQRAPGVRRRGRTRTPYDVHSRAWGRLPLGHWNSWSRETLEAPLPWRVWMLALGRLGTNGHAPFRPGELELANRHGVLYTERAVQNAIASLKRMNLVAPSSTRRCIIVPTELVDLTLDSGTTCPACGHDQRWSWRAGGGWAPSDIFDSEP